MNMSLSVLGRADRFAPPLPIPLVAGFVRTGFPSPADDYLECELDLMEHLVQQPSATYFLRAKGTSMEGAGIYNDDLLIVNRSVEPKPGHIVIMSVDGELTCKKLSTIGNRPYLVAANPEFRPIPLQGKECQVWGVVTHNIHSLAPGFSV